VATGTGTSWLIGPIKVMKSRDKLL